MRMALHGTTLALVILASPLYAAMEFRFDFGPPDSPVADGFTGAAAADSYSPQRGYGWSAGAVEDFVTSKPKINRQRWYHFDPNNYYDEIVDDLRRDGVESDKPFAFKVDLPPGKYRVLVTVGHLIEPRYSVDIHANGKLAARKVDARHWLSSERGKLHYGPGFYRRVKFPVEVGAGGLTLEFKGDDAEFQREMAIEKAKGHGPVRADGGSLPIEHAPWRNIGGPFTKISLMGIEVYPDTPLPLSLDPGSLKMRASKGSADDPAVAKAMAAFNAREFKAADESFRAVSNPFTRGLGLMALAGRPDYENEIEDATAAVEALREAAKAPGGDGRAREELGTAEIFLNGLILYRDAAVPPRGGALHRWRGINEFNQSEPEDFTYYKSLIYQGRMLNTEDPHQWAWSGEEGDRLLRIAEEKFPDNRFIRFDLHKEWKPYGDGTHANDWVWVDYESQVKDSPEWVKWIYPASQVCVDWAEWWVRFRQQSNGAIGGGWGDDVEIVGAFGYIGFVSRDLSKTLVPGTARLVEGVWNESEVDPELGFCLPLADAEHTAEWTGNTLGMMVVIDYGNPVWIERSVKTAQLMRDLWTDINAKGRRHFRANYFGASQIGSGDQMNDSWINYRGVRPASAVLSYNQNPDIAKLYIELADAWLAEAMSDERGKPVGVIPAQVSFPLGLLGGVNSPNWWTAVHTPGTVNYDWDDQSYKDYLLDVLCQAYRLTGDRKYLEPMRLEYELAAKHGETPSLKGGANLQPVPDPRKPTPPPVTQEAAASQAQAGNAKGPDPGTEAWVGSKIKLANRWLLEKRKMEGRKGALENNLTKDDIIVAGMHTYNEFKRSWPRRTTEAGPTDRIAFSGLVNPYLVYTGGRIGGALLEAAVTYNDTGRDFAAAVVGSDPQGLRILFHSLATAGKEIGFLPWQLEPAAKYQLRYGPDADEDEKMDTVVDEREIDFRQIGSEIRIRVEPRITYVIELEQKSRGTRPSLAPDPALTADDIRYSDGKVLARIHNVGAASVRNVEVAAYEGDPKSGGKSIGKAVIPNIEAPVALQPQTTTVGFPWTPTDGPKEIHIVVDPERKLETEITTFNNSASRLMDGKEAQ